MKKSYETENNQQNGTECTPINNFFKCKVNAPMKKHRVAEWIK